MASLSLEDAQVVEKLRKTQLKGVKGILRMCEANVKHMEPKHWFQCLFSTFPVVFHQMQAEMIEIESEKAMDVRQSKHT